MNTDKENTEPHKENKDSHENDQNSQASFSEEELRKRLSPEAYKVARESGTERPFTGKYWDFEGVGDYSCAVCGNPLFSSDGKFNSSCGWPSFFEAANPEAMTYHEDKSHGMHRTEVRCGKCDSHLGHVFDDGPPPTGKRYCINSVVIDFQDSSSPSSEK